MFENALFLIPARGGSKGIPQKNSKLLGYKPLIYYSIEYARLFTTDKNICLSTDDEKILHCAAQINLTPPFIRPANLSTDTAGTFEVMHHAIDFYSTENKNYEYLILLQPTSPFRQQQHLVKAFELMDEHTQLVVSVVKQHNNPYFNLFEEDKSGFLKISKGNGEYIRRQDCPPVFAFNGSIYIFRVNSLVRSNSFRDFDRLKKYEMEEKFSIDLDTPADWKYCEYLLESGYFN